MARKNPVTSMVAGSVPGLEAELFAPNLKEMEKPEVNMSPNNGDQKDVPSPAFATGKDLRNYEGGGSKSDPTPAKPGA